MSEYEKIKKRFEERFVGRIEDAMMELIYSLQDIDKWDNGNVEHGKELMRIALDIVNEKMVGCLQ